MNAITKLLQDKSYLKILEAHNGITARLVEQSKFDGIWESSLTDSASKGLPDIEIVSTESRLHTVREIKNVSTKPIIFDGDTGGDPNHFAYHIKMMETSNISMVIIEDKKFPKKNSLANNVTHLLEDADFFAQKIKKGKEASDNILIIARLEGLIANCSQQEVLSRAKKYIEAGADGVMIHSKKKNSTEICEFAKNYRKYCNKLLIAVPTTYNLTEEQIAKYHFDIIIYANHLLRASLQAMNETIYNLEQGNCNELHIATIEDIFNITNYDSRSS